MITANAYLLVETITVDAFEAEVDLPPFEGQYTEPEADDDEALLALALSRSRTYIYKYIPWFRYVHTTKNTFNVIAHRRKMVDESYRVRIPFLRKPSGTRHGQGGRRVKARSTEKATRVVAARMGGELQLTSEANQVEQDSAST